MVQLPWARASSSLVNVNSLYEFKDPNPANYHQNLLDFPPFASPQEIALAVWAPSKPFFLLSSSVWWFQYALTVDAETQIRTLGPFPKGPSSPNC